MNSEASLIKGLKKIQMKSETMSRLIYVCYNMMEALPLSTSVQERDEAYMRIFCPWNICTPPPYWLRELCEWVGFYSGERREQWRSFQQSLEQLRDTGVQPRQGQVRVHGGLNAWWQTHTECFTQEPSADKHSWHRETESRPKRPRQAGPGVLQGVQDLIAELVAKGYRIVYTDGSSKRLSHAQGWGLWRIRSGR